MPVIDIISDQNVIRDTSWKTCHDAFISESPNRKGILAYKTSHYIFLDNSRLTINAIVSLYSDIQKPEVKAKILENAYAYELTSANDDYRKKIEFQYSDNDLNAWGKKLLQKNDVTNALEILKLNASLYPESVVACNGLGEAYLKTGHIELAAVNYKKLMELNPDNRNSKAILDQIDRITEVPDSILTSYVGEYELNGVPLSITKENDNLFINFNNTRSVAYSTSNIDFFIVEYRDEFKFKKDSDGKVLGFLFHGMNAKKVK